MSLVKLCIWDVKAKTFPWQVDRVRKIHEFVQQRETSAQNISFFMSLRCSTDFQISFFISPSQINLRNLFFTSKLCSFACDVKNRFRFASEKNLKKKFINIPLHVIYLTSSRSTQRDFLPSCWKAIYWFQFHFYFRYTTNERFRHLL